MRNVGWWAVFAGAALGPSPGSADAAEAPSFEAATRDEDAPEAVPLAEVLRRLDAGNLTLEQARARADEAWGVARQATAAVLPVLSATGSYVRNNEEAKLSMSDVFGTVEDAISDLVGVPVELDTSALPDDTVIQPLEAFTATLGARLPLFAAQSYADIAAARAAARAAEAGVEVARQQLESAFVQAAWTAGAAEGYVRAGERALASAEAHRDAASRAARAGTGTSLAVLQAEAEVVRRRGDVVEARAGIRKAWRALGSLLGEDGPLRVDVSALEATEDSGADVEGMVGDALLRRPELRVQDSLRKAARLQVDSAGLRALPTLSASFGWSASSVDFMTGESTAWRLSLDLSWTLYDGGFRYGRLRQARAQVRAADAALRDQRVQVSRQVRDALADLDVSRERLALAEKQRALAEEADRTARRGFENGVVSSLDALDAGTRLFQADVGLEDARARVGRAAAALRQARGAGQR